MALRSSGFYALVAAGGLIGFLLLAQVWAELWRDKAPPVLAEQLSFERVEIDEHLIAVKVRAESQATVHIAQIMIDSAYWVFEQKPNEPLQRGQTAWITVAFPWVENEAHHLRIVTSDGATFDKTIDTAHKTPSVSKRTLWRYTLIGIFVGVIPVLLGMAIAPTIKALGPRAVAFSLSLTIGLLAYLLIDMIDEALSLASAASSVFNGASLVAAPLLLSYATLNALAQVRTSHSREGFLALMIALAIGLHNFGEGLSIGASFATNELILGAYLIVGFTLHNITEGLGIVAPLGLRNFTLLSAVGLAVVAGLPVVPGIWIGALIGGPHFSALFFGIGAGAIMHVIVELDRYTNTRGDDADSNTRFSATAVAGYFTGMGVMALTALLISN